MKKLNKVAMLFASSALESNGPEDVDEQVKLIEGELIPKPAPLRAMAATLAPTETAYTYPDHSPWAILEGNYEGQIDWSDLMKNQKKTATSDDDAASLKRPPTPMHSRRTTVVRAAPGVLRRQT